MILAGTSTANRFVFSETLSMQGLLFLTGKKWGFSVVYGMPKAGQLEVGLTRLTGTVHLSLHGSVGSGQELATGVDRRVSINVPRQPQQTGTLPLLTAS